MTGLSILVLEDEPLLRKQAATYLERLGADVMAAETVERARTLIDDFTFDFALLDVNAASFAEEFDIVFSNAALHWIKAKIGRFHPCTRPT